MTITYPRLLPTERLVECTFDLMDGVVISPSGGGKFLNRTQTTDPVWKLKAMTPPLTREDRAIWGAWKKSLQGGLKTFRTFDHTKPNPRAYPTATIPQQISGGWNGLTTVTSVGLSGALSLAGAPATYQAKVGDHVSLIEGGRYGLYEILEDATAVAGAITLNVTPFLHTDIFTTAAVGRLWRPEAIFVIDWQSWQEPTGLNPQAISFEAYQVI